MMIERLRFLRFFDEIRAGPQSGNLVSRLACFRRFIHTGSESRQKEAQTMPPKTLS